MDISKHLRRFALAAAAAFLLSGVPSALAQQPPDHDTTRAELANYDQFMDRHPQLEQQLRKNPNLVNNPNFMRQHPGFREFLRNHPGVREEMKENPKAFMAREHHYEKTEAREHRRDRDRDHDRDRDRR